MRNLDRATRAALQVLERARTIAVVGANRDQRSRTTTAYLRRVGFDVLRVDASRVTDIPGAVDVVLVFRTPRDVPALLAQAAAKRVDAVWLTEQPGPAVRSLARRLNVPLVFEPDVVARHRELQNQAGQPVKLGVRGRRHRRKDPVLRPLSPPGGWAEAGGGGRKGGGGGRAVIDEKKMITGRPGRRGRRRAYRSRGTAAA
jgi:predicted CoA-binding protein